MANAVAVTGLREMIGAFRAADRALESDLKDVLLEAAQPVRRDAQALAASQITNVNPGDPWAGMRVGIGRAIAYVAPIERGAKARGDQRKRRPKFATKMLNEAMQPALDRNGAEVERRFAGLVDDVVRAWGRG